MKLKLFLISIFILISFISYQKYSEYSSLKSINSYDSCITAKGSIIQESYPATCVTHLGSSFIQQITTPIATTTASPIQSSKPVSNTVITTPVGWEKFEYNDYKFSFFIPPEYRLYQPTKTPTGDLIISFRHKDYVIIDKETTWPETRYFQIILKRSDLSLSEYVAEVLGLSKLTFGRFDSGHFSQNRSDIKYSIEVIDQKILNNQHFIFYTLMGAGKGDTTYIVKSPISTTIVEFLDNYYSLDDEMVNQILASFKFTD